MDEQGVAAMVRTFPPILGLNPEKNIEPKLAWLRENVDLDEELVLGLVKVCSGLLFSAECYWLLHCVVACCRTFFGVRLYVGHRAANAPPRVWGFLGRAWMEGRNNLLPGVPSTEFLKREIMK